MQVYKGRLKSTGEEVALKVQRPGIGEQICIDMVLLRRLMMTVDSTLPKLRLPIQVLICLRLHLLQISCHGLSSCSVVQCCKCMTCRSLT